jgi:NAD(P)-dependent dehydrogenase (short-subunit alcohol dehydrogenase family)
VASLSGKRALVVGGSTGLGFACAEAMLREGARVFLSSRRRDVLQAAVGRLATLGPVASRAGDATRSEDVEALVAEAAETMGGIDTLLISAGTSGRTAIATTPPDLFQAIVDHNLRPVFLASRFTAPHLESAGSGSIIAISSMYGLVGQKERVAYCTAKSGVIGMIRAVALDLAPLSIRANAICPGFIETELARATAAQEADPERALTERRSMHPIPRAGSPEEVGALAAYLASDAASFITGQAIALDGGYSAR